MDKLLPAARAPFDRMAEVLCRRGFEAAVHANSEAGSRFLAIEVMETGERVGTFTLVKYISVAAGAETTQRPILSAGLYFAGGYDIEVSSSPCHRPRRLIQRQAGHAQRHRLP
ncbi:MAG: hypothetical protein K2X55_12210 [Burkholderiaceae bacterium]|nr:hypothetical protein [Burkholderiaceae bacterium]